MEATSPQGENLLSASARRSRELTRLFTFCLVERKSSVDDLTDQEPPVANAASVETENEKLTVEEASKENSEESDAKESDPDKTDPSEVAFRQQWMKKKTLYVAAEREKEHLMNFYMLINQRLLDLNIELVNIRQWRIDKEVQRKELVERAENLEKLVSQKRRNKPVPPRSSIEEMDIWIKVQHEANEALQKLVSRCLSIKLEDSVLYSEFSQAVRDMYLSSLKEQLSQELEIKVQSTWQTLPEDLK